MRKRQIGVWIQSRAGRCDYLEWIDDAGRRRSRSTGSTNRRIVEQMRADLEYELNHGMFHEKSRLTLGEFCELYRSEHLDGLRPRSREKASHVLKSFQGIAGAVRLATIDENTLAAFVVRLRRQKKAPWTVRNYVGVVRAALRWAAARKLIDRVPAFPPVKVPTLRPRAVPSEAFDRFYGALRCPQERALAALGWWAGLRLLEAYELRRTASRRWPYVSADKIIVPAAFSKNSTDQWVPIHPRIAEALAAVPVRRGSPRYFLLRSAIDGKPITRSGLTHRFRTRAKSAGVRMSFHSLRRGFGSRLAASQPAAVVKQLMRHSSLDLTMAFYANVDAGLAGAVGSLD